MCKSIVFLGIFAILAGVHSFVLDTAEIIPEENNIHNVRIRDVGSNDKVQGFAFADSTGGRSGNGRFFGHAISSFYSSTNENGKVSEKRGGQEVVNDNGQISRRYF